MTKPTILLLSASVGYGHINAATQLKLELQHRLPGWDIIHANICDFAPFWQRFILEKAWRIANTLPLLRHLYSYLHKIFISDDGLASKLRFIFNKIAINIAIEYKNTDIQALVALHPGAACAAGLWKRRRNFYLAVATTDFVVHSFQVFSGVDRIFGDRRSVFASKMAFQAKSNGRFMDTGLPILNKKTESPKNTIWNQIGSTSQYRILVTFGGLGLRADRHIHNLFRLLENTERIKIILVCGLNIGLERRVRFLVGRLGYEDRIVIFGFRTDMADLMREADLIIGKAGGMTMCEAFNFSTPMIVIDLLPGQEEYNVAVMKKENGGRTAFCFKELRTAVLALEQTNRGRSKDLSSFNTEYGVHAIGASIVCDIARYGGKSNPLVLAAACCGCAAGSMRHDRRRLAG